MKRIILTTLALTGLCLHTLAAAPEAGFQSIFNGHDLTGWDGNRTLWFVKDGAIVGQTTAEHPAKGNTFLIWTNGPVTDFELRFSYKIVPNNTVGFANSGVQYRSKIFDPANYVLGGYQADMEAGDTYSGILYEERMRGILAERGQKVVLKEVDGKLVKDVTGSVGDSKEIQAAIKKEGWNDYVIIAQGNHLQHFINGRQTVDVTDETGADAAKSGVMGLQLHAGQPMTVEFKDVRIKQLSSDGAMNPDDAEKLQGKWEVTGAEFNGNTITAGDLNDISLTIHGKTFESTHDAQTDRGAFTVNNARKPLEMDVRAETGNWAGRTVPAIYELAGDTLRICYAVEGTERPKVFTTEQDSGRLTVSYKRK